MRVSTASERLEARREVAERARFLDDAVATQALTTPSDRDTHLDHVVDVALRVRAARNREPHEIHGSRALRAVGVTAEHRRCRSRLARHI